MVAFPNCKINLGLYITHKRQDGFHDIETLFYPLQNITDALEIQKSNQFELIVSGTNLQIASEQNIVYKAFQLLQKDFDLPSIKVYLHKNIPHGAGLGGGSADASAMLQLCNSYFNLNIETTKLLDYALQLGSDCPFFIINKPAFGNGRGEVLTPIELNLNQYKIVLIKPPFHVSTKDAFAGIHALNTSSNIQNTISTDITNWKDNLHNQFENIVSKIHPLIATIKNSLYQNGALYASMTGTGSVVYGIFDHDIDTDAFNKYGQVFVN